jgi:hypothetical protein
MPPKKDDETRNDVRIKRATNQLDTISLRVSKIADAVNAFNPETNDAFFLEEKQISLQTAHREYQQHLADLYEVLPDEDCAARMTEVTEFEECLDDANVVIRRKLSKIKKPSTSTGNNNESKSRIRLPEIPLPTFSGDYNEWVYFREKFTVRAQ